MYKIGFIVNGKKRHKRKLYRELGRVKDTICNVAYNFIETSWSGHAVLLAREFAQQGYSHIIAVGGDGTLHEVVNGVATSGKSAIIGLLPFGSANDFARTINTPRTLQEVFTSINNNAHTSVDIGKINCTQAEGQSVEKYFINIADLGIGADVVQRVNSSSRWLGSSIIFYKSILRSFLSYKNKTLFCKTSDWSWSGKINSLVIANGRYFGNGMCIAPDANTSDGSFQIIVIGDITISDYLKQISKIKKGQRIDHEKLSYRQATSLKLESKDGCAIEADGEFLGYTPCEIQIQPSQLDFLVIANPV